MQKAQTKNAKAKAGKHGPFESVDHIDDIYKLTVNENISRFELIEKRFSEMFSDKLKHVVRVPSIADLPLGQNYDFFKINSLKVCIEKDTVVAFSERVHDNDIVICALENIKFPKVQLKVDDPLKFKLEEAQTSENLTKESFKHYNAVMCACKAFFNEGNLSGKRKPCNILIDNNAPYNEGFQNTLGQVTGIYLALYKLQGNIKTLSIEKAIENIFKYYTIQKSDKKIDEIELRRNLRLLLEGRGQVLLLNEDHQKDQFIKEFENDGQVFINSCRNSSEMQNKSFKMKKLIEFRICLRLQGVQDFSKFIGLEDFMQKFDYNWESLKVEISEYLEDRTYMANSQDELCEESVSNLVQDVPEAFDSIGNYFSFNPKKTIDLYIKLAEFNQQMRLGFLTSINLTDEEQKSKVKDDQWYIMKKFTEAVLANAEIESKAIEDIRVIINDCPEIKAFSQVGRRFMNSFVCITNKEDAKKCNNYIVDNYLKFNQDSLLITDDFSRLGFCSSFAKAVVFQDPDHELWH